MPPTSAARGQMGWGMGVGEGGLEKASATNFTLKLRSSHNKFWQATGKDRWELQACGAVSVLNISESAETWHTRIDYSIVTRLGLGLNQSDTDRQLENLFWHEDGKRQKSK